MTARVAIVEEPKCLGCIHYGSLFRGAIPVCTRPIEGEPGVYEMRPIANFEDVKPSAKCVAGGWREEPKR